MIPIVVLQMDDYEPWQRAIRDQFGTGGLSGVVLLVVLLAGLALVTYYFTDRRKTAKPPADGDPLRFYSTLLGKLDLTPPQRRLLDALARDTKLAHAAALLLSPTLFEHCLEHWQANRPVSAGPAPAATDPKLVANLRSHLFPAPSPWVVGDKS